MKWTFEQKMAWIKAYKNGGWVPKPADFRRTSKIVEFIVEEMTKDSSLHINHRFYANVIKAAPMHDLGKIAVGVARPAKSKTDAFSLDALKNRRDVYRFLDKWLGYLNCSSISSTEGTTPIAPFFWVACPPT